MAFLIACCSDADTWGCQNIPCFLSGCDHTHRQWAASSSAAGWLVVRGRRVAAEVLGIFWGWGCVWAHAPVETLTCLMPALGFHFAVCGLYLALIGHVARIVQQQLLLFLEQVTMVVCGWQSRVGWAAEDEGGVCRTQRALQDRSSLGLLGRPSLCWLPSASFVQRLHTEGCTQKKVRACSIISAILHSIV